MFRTKYNDVLFTYETWESSGGWVSFHSDSCHMIAMVFYNQLLKFRNSFELNQQEYMYHKNCLNSHFRTRSLPGCLNLQES